MQYHRVPALHALLVTACLLPALCAEESAPPPGEARILHPLPDGAAPAPIPPPALVIAPEDVLESKTVVAGERRVTTEKIVPLELPDVPEPVPPPGPSSPEALRQAREIEDETDRETTLVFIGATVFRAEGLPGPRTLVQVWDQQTRSSWSCWSSADWNWLAGIGSFQGEDGRQYALIMSHGSVDIGDWSEFMKGRGKEYAVPAIPDFPAGDAAFAIAEGTPAGEALAPIAALHRIVNKDGERLKAAHEGRERARQEREESLRLDPPQPRSLVIRHWRMDEASRQGLTPKPAVAR